MSKGRNDLLIQCMQAMFGKSDGKTVKRPVSGVEETGMALGLGMPEFPSKEESNGLS
jgi:hypothetical protein